MIAVSTPSLPKAESSKSNMPSKPSNSAPQLSASSVQKESFSQSKEDFSLLLSFLSQSKKSSKSTLTFAARPVVLSPTLELSSNMLASKLLTTVSLILNQSPSRLLLRPSPILLLTSEKEILHQRRNPCLDLTVLHC